MEQIVITFPHNYLCQSNVKNGMSYQINYSTCINNDVTKNVGQETFEQPSRDLISFDKKH